MPEVNASGESISMFVRGFDDLFDPLGKLAVAGMSLSDGFGVVDLFALQLAVVFQPALIE